MLFFLWSIWLLLANVDAQGPGGGGGGQPEGAGEQECMLLITSPIFVCEDDSSKSYMDASDLNTVRMSENLTVVRGNVKMMKTFDKNSMVEIKLDKIANGKKEMMISLEVKLCDELGREESDFYPLLKYMKFPEACPIEEGQYLIDDLVVDMEDLPINSANIGEYEAGLIFYNCKDENCKDKEQVACAKLDCVIEPL